MKMRHRVLIPFFAAGLLLGAYLIYAYAQEPRSFQEYFGEPEYKKVNPDIPLDEQTSIVQIGERVFKIPSIYIQTDLKDEKEQDGINLLYVYPDFTSRADFKNREEYYEAEKQRRFGHMLVQKLGIKVPFDKAITNLKRGRTKIIQNGEKYGLIHETWYRDSGEGERPYDDVFLEYGNNGMVASYIQCAHDTRVLFSGCSHMFFDKGLYYDVYYNKKNYLEDWKKYRQAAINFIDSLEYKPDTDEGE